MAQDTRYNEKIDKLKEKREGIRLFAGIYGFLTAGLGAALMYYLKEPPSPMEIPYLPLPPSTAYFLGRGCQIGCIIGTGVMGFLAGRYCYKEIANSRRISKKIRKLEKKISEV